MNPEISHSSVGIENNAPKFNNSEQLSAFGSVEKNNGLGVENTEANQSEVSSKVAEIDITSILPVPSIQPMSTPVALPQISDNPKIAADVDVIEKEWVDKAKKIVNETHDDPYLQGKKISELQVDYKEKRYGGGLGTAA